MVAIDCANTSLHSSPPFCSNPSKMMTDFSKERMLGFLLLSVLLFFIPIRFSSIPALENYPHSAPSQFTPCLDRVPWHSCHYSHFTSCFWPTSLRLFILL